MRPWLAFWLVVAIWSTTPLAIKWGTQIGSFSFAVLLRLLIGTTICGLLLWLLRTPFPLNRRACYAYAVGGCCLFSSMALTYWAAQFVNSGTISVLYGLTPLITSLLAIYWLQEKFNRYKLLGLLLGIGGLSLIFHPSLHFELSAALALIGLLLAVALQALGLVWMKRIQDNSPPLATTLGSALVALPLFFLLWLWADGQPPTHFEQTALWATLYAALFGSVLGFVLYYYLIKHMEASRIALITLITPVLALWLGHQFNHEVITWQTYLGTAAILFGLIIHQREPR